MIEEGEVHEVLYAIALGLAEETNSEIFVHGKTVVELFIVGLGGRIPLCLLTIDDEKCTVMLQFARGQFWNEPIIVDLTEPDSIEKIFLPMIPMSNMLKKGLGGGIEEEKPPNKWAHRSIFMPRNRR